MDEVFNDLFETAEEHKLTHAIISYLIDDSDPDNFIMMVKNVALYQGVPHMWEIVDLFSRFASQEEMGLNDMETMMNLYCRAVTIEDLRELLSSPNIIDPARINKIVIEEGKENDGWQYGVAGNA